MDRIERTQEDGQMEEYPETIPVQPEVLPLPLETPGERERREMDEFIIRQGLLERLKRGDDPLKPNKKPPEVIN